MKKKLLHALTCCCLLTSALSVNAYASGTTLNKPGSGTATIGITAEPTTFSVTVPTQIAVTRNTDGATITPDPNVLYLKNDSYGKVKVSSVKVTAKGSDKWTVIEYDEAVKGLPFDSKKVGLAITPYKTTGIDTDASIDGSAGTMIKTESQGQDNVPMNITVADEWIMDGNTGTNNTIQMDLGFETGNVTEKVDNQNLVDIVFTIGWMGDLAD